MFYSPQAAEEVDFDEAALLRMQGCTVTLQEIAACFASLKPGEAEASLWEFLRPDDRYDGLVFMSH